MRDWIRFVSGSPRTDPRPLSLRQQKRSLSACFFFAVSGFPVFVLMNEPPNQKISCSCQSNPQSNPDLTPNQSIAHGFFSFFPTPNYLHPHELFGDTPSSSLDRLAPPPFAFLRLGHCDATPASFRRRRTPSSGSTGTCSLVFLASGGAFVCVCVCVDAAAWCGVLGLMVLLSWFELHIRGL